MEELLFVDGMDAALFEKLSPHLTVYGSGTFINVNSASRAVLVAFLLENPLAAANAELIADQIIAARKDRGFAHRDDFYTRLPEVPREWGLDRQGLDFSSTAFRGIGVGMGVGGIPGLEIVFVWDTIARQYVLWRER
ncbi:MAG: hypothetical protein ACNA71_00965 [Kiritimatiellia bacterium]